MSAILFCFAGAFTDFLCRHLSSICISICIGRQQMRHSGTRWTTRACVEELPDSQDISGIAAVAKDVHLNGST